MSQSRQLPLKVLYEDNHLIAVFKPHRVPTQGDRGGDLNLLDMTKHYLKERYQKPGNVFLGMVHRLDRPVAGVVIFAKTSKAASRLSESIRLKEVEKTYHALVEGKVEGEAELVHYVKAQETKPVEIQKEMFPQAKKALLRYRCLKTQAATSLLEISLITGRKHQIRAQLASIGHPIVGDKKYGATLPYTEGAIALLAKSLEFQHPVKEERVRITVAESVEK